MSRTIGRDEVWIRAYCAVARCENTTGIDQPVRWADHCLAAFDRTFPPTDEINTDTKEKASHGEGKPHQG